MRKKVLFTGVAVPLALMAAPQAYAADDWGGFTCGFASTDDPTGVITQDPTKQTGEVNCGPVIVLNSDGGTISSVTVTACFKVNDNTYGGGICVSNTTSGNVGFLVTTISYHADADDDVYIGTTVSWTSSKGGGTSNYDCDEATAGEQTCIATSTEIPPEV